MHQAGDPQQDQQQNDTQKELLQAERHDSPTTEPLQPHPGSKSIILIGVGIVLLLIGALIGYLLRQGEVMSLQQRVNQSAAASDGNQNTTDAKEQTSSVAKADASQVSAGMDCMEKVSGARSLLTKAVLKSKDEDGRSIEVEHNNATSKFKWLTVVPEMYDAQCNKTSATLRDLKANEYITLYISGETVNEGQVLAIQRLNN
jgi:hypothetical protein